jgi:hypothetical protein
MNVSQPSVPVKGIGTNDSAENLATARRAVRLTLVGNAAAPVVATKSFKCTF